MVHRERSPKMEDAAGVVLQGASFHAWLAGA